MTTIYHGPRNETFCELIKKLLECGSVKRKYIKLLTSEENMKVYANVFTHKSADSENNYELYEILGDSTLNKAIVWYIIKRFPMLKKSQYVPVISRLKINLVSKKSFSALASDLDLWTFISAEESIRATKMKLVLDDVFEGFFGATEMLLDTFVEHGVGYVTCLDIVSAMFDRVEISLKYEDVYDSKTRLKELIDKYRFEIGNFVYEETPVADCGMVQSSVVLTRLNGMKETIGFGKAFLKQDAQQKASQYALETLNRRGVFKPIPQIFQDLERDIMSG